MAAPSQATSGRTQATAGHGRGPPTVRVIAAPGAAVHRRVVPTSSRRVSARIVQVVLLATSAFALLDLYLLLSSGHQ